MLPIPWDRLYKLFLKIGLPEFNLQFPNNGDYGHLPNLLSSSAADRRPISPTSMDKTQIDEAQIPTGSMIPALDRSREFWTGKGLGVGDGLGNAIIGVETAWKARSHFLPVRAWSIEQFDLQNSRQTIVAFALSNCSTNQRPSRISHNTEAWQTSTTICRKDCLRPSLGLFPSALYPTCLNGCERDIAVQYLYFVYMIASRLFFQDPQVSIYKSEVKGSLFIELEYLLRSQ